MAFLFFYNTHDSHNTRPNSCKIILGDECCDSAKGDKIKYIWGKAQCHWVALMIRRSGFEKHWEEFVGHNVGLTVGSDVGLHVESDPNQNTQKYYI